MSDPEQRSATSDPSAVESPAGESPAGESPAAKSLAVESRWAEGAPSDHPSADSPASDPPPRRIVEQRGLYFDELEPGTCYRHRPGRTVTEADNVLFTTLTMNSQALHLDAAFAATQPFGQRLVNSMLTLATMVGSSVGQLTQGTLVANLGFGAVAFPHPLFHGDTLYCETEVLGKRLSASRPGQGIVTLAHTGRNQDDTVVGTAERTVLVWCEGARP